MTLPLLDHWFGIPPDASDPGEIGSGRRRKAAPETSRSTRESVLSPADVKVLSALASADTQEASRALEQLHRDWAIPLARYAERLTHASDVADDIVQDVFLSVWARRTDLLTAGSIRAYLFGAVHRRGLQALRHAKVIDRWSERVAGEILASPALSGSIPATPDSTAQADEFASVIREAIERLAPRQREALLLYRVQELSLAEVAEVMGVSLNTVKVQLQRAGARVREAVERYLA